MFRSISLIALVLGVLFVMAGAGSSVATVINFDTLGSGAVVTDQYPEAMFSSDPGYENRTATYYLLNMTFPCYIMTATIDGMYTAVNTTQVDFTDPVNDLTFQVAGDDDSGVTAQVDVYVNFVFEATVDIVTNADFYIPHLVDLSAYSNVTKIVIHSITDGGGLAWDTFSFTPVTVSTENRSWGDIKKLYR